MIRAPSNEPSCNETYISHTRQLHIEKHFLLLQLAKHFWKNRCLCHTAQSTNLHPGYVHDYVDILYYKRAVTNLRQYKLYSPTNMSWRISFPTHPFQCNSPRRCKAIEKFTDKLIKTFLSVIRSDTLCTAVSSG